ncbi:MAG: hydrolase [Herminiimonas sp.]|nr:hydrolase [Herminiimonas sp.]
MSHADGESKITLRSRQLVCENTVFSVFVDHIVGKEGLEVPRYLSVLPKNVVGDSISGVAVLPVMNGKLGLIRIFRHPLGRWSWEAPKGMVEAGEELPFAALRELREETGFSVPRENLVDLGAIAPEPGVLKGRIRLFSAALAGSTGGKADGEIGHGEMAFFTREEVIKLIESGEIEDACTLAIMLKHEISQKSSAA